MNRMMDVVSTPVKITNNNKKLLDYSTHRAEPEEDLDKSLSWSVSNHGKSTAGRRVRTHAPAGAVEEALSTTELLLGSGLPLQLEDKSSRSCMLDSSTNSTGLSCSERLRESFQRRTGVQEPERSEREQALLASVSLAATATALSSASSAHRKPTKLKRTAFDIPEDPPSCEVKVSFAFKLNSNSLTATSAHSAPAHSKKKNLDHMGDSDLSSSVHRLHKSLLGLHLDQDHSSRHDTPTNGMDLSVQESVPDHRRRRELHSLEDSFGSLTFHEDDHKRIVPSNPARHQPSTSAQPNWVSRPKSVVDIAGKMYKQYNAFALSLSGSSHSALCQSPYQGLDLGSNLLGSNSLPSHTHALASSQSSTLKEVNLRTLLKARKKAASPNQDKQRSNGSYASRFASSKLKRLNASTSSLLDASYSSLLDISLQRGASTGKQGTGNNARWAAPVPTKDHSNGTMPHDKKASLTLPAASKLALLAALNRSSSTRSSLWTAKPSPLDDSAREPERTRMVADKIQDIFGKTNPRVANARTPTNNTAGMEAPKLQDATPPDKIQMMPSKKALSSNYNNHHNFTWESPSCLLHNGVKEQQQERKRNRATNPFLSILNAESDDNATMHSALTERKNRLLKKRSPMVQNHKRIKVVTDGGSVVSRSSSFASTNMESIDDLDADSHHNRGAYDCDSNLSEAACSGDAPKKLSSEHGRHGDKRYQLLLQTRKPETPTDKALALTVNLHQKSSLASRTLSAARLGALLTARRTHSRANLMSGSFAQDPSHFVTGSRIRRFQSSGALI